MEFLAFRKKLQDHFIEMAKDAANLFEIEIDKDVFWNLYLDSFPAGTNNIFRERREHDCSCCRHFIRTIGNAVVIKDNKVITLWDFDAGEYQPVVDVLSAYLKARAVSDMWVHPFRNVKTVGTERNYEQTADRGILTWDHFFLQLPDKFVNTSSRSVGDIQGEFRTAKSVFQRALEEISEGSLLTVLELISQNSLYKGEEWNAVLRQFLGYKKAYMKLTTDEQKNNFAWVQSIQAGPAIARIRNHSIGTLLVDISEGRDLDAAVRSYEVKVAPTNYKRPKAIFTQKMLDDARKTLEDLGYMSALGRRFATLNDITVNNILFSNRDAARRIAGAAAGVFDEMKQGVAVDPKKFSRVEEVTAADFVNNILPTAKTVEVFLENRHASNLVSLIAPEDIGSKSMFKWNNGFSWAYAGNITDSDMRENVKAAGGDVNGVLRFSIQWNDIKPDQNDLDAHCIEPDKYELYYANRGTITPSGGKLDVDIISPTPGRPAVENITYATTGKMKEGKYFFYVNCFNNRGGNTGFRAEIEIDGQIYSYEYNKPLRHKENIHVAVVTYSKAAGFSIEERLPSSVSSREIWKLNTNQFVPVSVVMYSPNYWDEQDGIGHRHYFFMLKDCVNSETPNGFYNEFLREDLMQHKRVFEALGSKMAVKDVEDQLSGLGFSSTKRNELLVKVTGNTERVLKIKF